VDKGNIFFYHRAILNGFGKGGSSGLCAGKDHHTAHVFIQTVNGETFAAQLPDQFSRNFLLGIQSDWFDAYGDLLVRIENFHENVLTFDIFLVSSF
jgi:hypothetical protein